MYPACSGVELLAIMESAHRCPTKWVGLEVLIPTQVSVMPEGPLANSSIAQQTWRDSHKVRSRSRRIGKVGIADAISELAWSSVFSSPSFLRASELRRMIMAAGSEHGPRNACELVGKCYDHYVPVRSGR